MNLTNFEFGWIIGILEGEGSFGYYCGTQRVSLEMTDEDTMVRAAIILSKVCNTVLPVREFERPNRVNRENHSTMFRLQVTGNKARLVMGFAVSHMSKRRRVKIWQALNGYAEKQSVSNVDILRLVREAK